MTRGLARVDKTQGMVVAYATAANDVANDGQGRNSPFTAALLKRLREPGLEIELMFRRVAADVDAQTGHRQHPEHTVSLLSEYYLNQSDRIVWERINQDDIAALRDFADKFPSSPLGIQARNRLGLLERYAREREEMGRRVREEEQRRLAEEADAKRRDELKRQEEQKRIAALEEQKRQEEQKRIAALEEQKRQEEQKRIAALEEQKRQEAQKRIAALEAQKRLEEQKRVTALEEQKRQEEQKRIAALDDQKRLEEQKRVAALEEQKRQEEQKRVAAQDEQKRLEEQKRVAALEEQKRQEEQKRIAALDDQKRLEEQKRIAALPADAPATKVQPSLAAPPGPTTQPVTKANLPEHIRKAQTELKRLGCFDGDLDGKMNTTEKAIKAFWQRSHKPIVEINITDDFIGDLQRHPDDFCVPPSKKPPAIANRPSPLHNKGTAAASPPPATAPREARQPPPVQQPARATAEARQPQPAQQPAAPRATGIGF